jgi:cytochrome c oxidase cbb3-type subunit III
MCLRCLNKHVGKPSAGKPWASEPRGRGRQADFVGRPDDSYSGLPLGSPAAKPLACPRLACPKGLHNREPTHRDYSLPCGSAGGLGWGQLRRAPWRWLALVISIAVVSSMSACHRENRYFEPPKNSDAPPTQVQLSSLVAGQSSPLQFREQQKKMYEENAYHLSEGKRLYTWFNCVGCHAHGGGDSGPPLMDDQWIYGGEIDQIYLTIVQGRPNGMPAFGGKIPSQQIWQLAAYVRSMGGHGPKAARPGRDDHIQKPSEQGRRDEELRGAPANSSI